MSARVTDLRHDAARRRAVAGLQHEPGREAPPGAPARAAGRRRHRGRLPDRLAGRVRGRPGDRRGGAAAPRSRRSPAPRRRTSRPRGARARGAPRRPVIHTFLATSAIHLKYKLKITPEEALRAGGRRACALARTFCADVEFSAEDASRTDYGYLREVLQAVHEAGRHDAQRARHGRLRAARRVRRDGRASCVRDIPSAVISRPLPQRPRPGRRQLARGRAGGRAPGRVHDQRHRRARGQHLARGVRDGAQGAPRGAAASRPASAPSCSRPPARMLSTVTGVWPQPNKAVVGRNAFAHEAGIHQHGILANPLCYEIMTPASVGAARDAARARQALGQARGGVAPQAARRGARGRARSRTSRAGEGARRPEEVRLRRGPARARRARARAARAARALPGRSPATRSCPRPRSRSRSTASGARPRRWATARSTRRSRPPTRRSASSCELLELHTRAVTAARTRWPR